MGSSVLIDSVVRQTTVLIASLATAAGNRASLSHVANEVLASLVTELKAQGLGNKVIADMFGMALRTYYDRVARLGESQSESGRSLWDAVLGHVQERGPVLRSQVLSRFGRDDEVMVKGVLRDLVRSGLLAESGHGDATVYRGATPEEQGTARAGDADGALANMVLVAVHRLGPCEREAIQKPGTAEPPTSDTALGLQACPEATAVEWLVDFIEPVACAAGLCTMQVDGVSALAQGGALVFANDQSARISPGVASVGLLDAEGALGVFAALPGAPESATSLGAGSYVAVARDETTSLLYRWQDGELASIPTPGGLVAMAGDDASVAVAGQLAPDLGQRRAWLALYEGAGAELWRIDAPADASSSSDGMSAAVARDPGDQSLAWLVSRYEDDAWRMAVVRVDAEGNPLWTTRLDPEGAAQWNTDRDDWLLNPGVAVAGGVTSIAGAVNSAIGGGVA